MSLKINKDKYDLSIVVPCYQEEGHLKQSVNAIYELLSHTDYNFEMIFVDDCSRDNTREVILTISRELPDVKYILRDSNAGRGGAFLEGVSVASGKYIGFLDIDLEVSCVYLIRVLSELEKGSDVVTVRRHYAIAPSFTFILRHILSVGYKALISSYLGIPKMDTETGFKFFNRECIFKLAPLIHNKKWFFDTEVMVLAYKHKYKIKEIDGLFLRRSDKATTVKVFRDTIEYFIEVWRFKKRMLKNPHLFNPEL